MMLWMTLISFFIIFITIIVNFFANSQLTNTTARPPVVVRPVNDLVFRPCFRLSCFQDLGCFEPYIIAAYISVPPLSVCPQNPNEMGVRFLVLASERVGGQYDKFLSLSEIKPDTKVAFMVHGILSEYDEYIYVLPGYLLLQEYDYVIFVEWSIPADPFVFERTPIPGLTFFLTHANVEVVGRMTANVIQKLKVERNIHPKNVRVDGFSAGGNMVEFIAEWARFRHKILIGKCTAIEMSGAPYFFTNKRLPHSGMCKVLDCVHATYNPKIPLLTELVAALAHFGAFESNCDSDYYINYPFAIIDQPGCLGIYFCSHLYGLIFYSSALMKCNYRYTTCDLYSIFFSNSNRTTRLDGRDHGPLGSVCVRSGNKPLSHC